MAPLSVMITGLFSILNIRTFIEPFRVRCEFTCFITDLSSPGESFVYQYFPQGAIKGSSKVVFDNLKLSHVDGEFLEKIGNIMDFVVIDYSKLVKKVLVPRRFNASRLYITETSLHTIDLEPNGKLSALKITGSVLAAVPPTIHHLKALQTVIITHGRVRMLDLASFCDMPVLKSIDVNANKIRYVINSFPSTTCSIYTSLVFLRLSGNLLKRMDLAMVSLLANMNYLDIRGNRMRFFHGGLVSDALTDIRLTNNKFASLSFCEWYLPKLTSLVLDRNALITVPTCLGNLKNVSFVRIASNRFSYALIDSFASMEELRELDLSWNRLTTITVNRPHYPKKLQILKIANNKLAALNLSFVPVRSLRVNVDSNFLSDFNLSEVSENVTELSLSKNMINCSSLTPPNRMHVTCENDDAKY